MGRFAATLVLAAAALGLLAPPDGRPPTRPLSPTAGRPAAALAVGLVPPERVAVVDLRNRRVASRRVPGGTLCGSSVLVTGGRLVLPAAVRGRGVALSRDLWLRGPGRPIGAMWQYVPSATPGRLWLFQAPRSRHWGRFASVREVSVGGRTTLRPPYRPPFGSVDGSTLDGVVTVSPGGIRVWDPRSGRVVLRRPEGFVLATGARRVAWCRGDCRTVRISEPGEDVALRLRASAGGGALSADGARLALAAGAHRLLLADLAGRSVREVPGVRLGGYGALAWDPSGRRLFAGAAGGRVVAVRAEGGRPQTIARLRGKIMELSAG